MTEAETTQPVRLATRVLKPSDLTKIWPRSQAAPGPSCQVLVTGSRNCRTLYRPRLTYQSPAGRTSVSPGARPILLPEGSIGALPSSEGYKFCGKLSPRPGPERG